MSTLRDALVQYVALRRVLGTELHEPARTLGYFVDFLEGQGAEFITTELAVSWAMKPSGVQRATWGRRLSMVRRFAAWLNTVDPRHQVPPTRLIDARHRRKQPYIFTEQEVERLMVEASRLSSPRGLRAQTYVTLIGLLATTGLRPSEAFALNVSDVDLQSGVLSIRRTKLGKSRFVPVAESARVALVFYSQQRDRLCRQCHTEAFFVSERGRRLDKSAARRTFGKISRAVGLRAATGRRRIGRGPRLQDFRHTFATRRLVEWYRAGLDVRRELPKLSTYLGHADVATTYWYLSAIPELLQLAAERLCSGKRTSSQ